MKVILPEHIGEITLGQFQKYYPIEKNEPNYNHKKSVVSIFCNVEESLIDHFPNKDIEEFYEQIMKALKQDVEFQRTFKLKGVEYGFHPNLDQMTGAEWVDLSNYQNDVSQYHKVMAILFRPIIEKDSFGNYKLETYSGTSQYAEKMKELPLSIVNGALVFFLNLAKELEVCIHRSINKGQARDPKLWNILRDGVGLLRL